jgi:hypothetical protein
MSAITRSVAVLLAIGVCLTAGGRRLSAQSPPDTTIRRGIDVTPDTVTVGLPFRVQIRVRAPAGSTMEFPIGPDSSAGVELLDPRSIQDRSDAAGADFTATYRMVAWDIGTQPVRLGEVIIDTPDGERRIPLGALGVFVQTVLPADSALRIPKPPRPPFALEAPWWRWWWVAALALALLLLGWWIWRRRRGPREAARVDPYELAEREFARVEALGLVEAGERGRFVALMVEVVRDYLARRVPGAHPSLTSGELLRALRLDPTVPVERLAVVLQESDLVKFARHPVSPERARELARESRALVREVNAAVAAREAAEAAAAAARAAEKPPQRERAA